MKNHLAKLKSLVERIRCILKASNKDCVIDSANITKKHFEHMTFVNAKGVLCFQCQNVMGEVVGVSEWTDELKKSHQVNTNIVVIDILIMPIPFKE